MEENLLNCFAENLSWKIGRKIVRLSFVENLQWIVCRKISCGKIVESKKTRLRGKYAGVFSVGIKTNNLLKTSVQQRFAAIAGLALAIFVSVEHNQVITSLSFKEIS